MSPITVGRCATRAGRKGPKVMSAAPQPAQPGRHSKTAPGDFEGFVDGALRDHVVGTGSLPSGQDVEPRQLLRYAGGKATDDERTALEDLLTRSRWAYDRVVTLVRCQRRDAGNSLANNLARRLLSGGSQSAVQIVGQSILEVEGVKAKSLEEAWETVEKDSNPKTRAACLIGLGRHEDARKLLESQHSKEPVWNLLRRVGSAAVGDDGDDAALLALLDVFPSLAGENRSSRG